MVQNYYYYYYYFYNYKYRGGNIPFILLGHEFSLSLEIRVTRFDHRSGGSSFMRLLVVC
jgi:hypothetical protein